MEAIRSLFSKFQRIQKLNTKAIGIMAEMERALGGEYIFDRAFLDRSIRELSNIAYQVVYSLNALSGNRYIGLFDRFQSIKSTLQDILAGGLGSLESNLALPFSDLGLEMEPLAGFTSVCLAEARNRLSFSAPDGFAVTVAGCQKFPAAKDELEVAKIPAELVDSIMREAQDLFARRGGPVELTVRACAAGGYASPQPTIVPQYGVRPEELLTACRKAVIDFINLHNQSPGGSGNSPLSMAIAVHEAVPARMAGSVSAGPAGFLRISVFIPGTAGSEEIYLIRRLYPFDPVRSDIVTKSTAGELEPGVTALSDSAGALRRGSALLDPAFLQTLGETSNSLERIFGQALEFDWSRGGSPDPVILDIRRAAGSESSDAGTADLLEPGRVDVLLQGGETVQTGIAAGRVVHLGSDGLTDPEELPHGLVVVSRTASPQLSIVLRKASAIVTETGTAVGHLATIARELRVPALFGAAGALSRLAEGTDVTVDAGERTVYDGIVESVLTSASGSDLIPTDPEYIMLRLLLRLIMPLGMVDPDSSDFVQENCRTYHDVIHFAHERSVEELLHIQERHRGRGFPNPRRLLTGVPMEIDILDIDSDPALGTSTLVAIDELKSEPLLAFLSGLTIKEMWDTGPAQLKLSDIFSNLDRTFRMISRPAHEGRNLAVVASNYMNIGLRLGYHFSVIDSYMGDNPNLNYVYFRFAGGFADEKRRRRRADLIRTILAGMDFKVTMKGDLVVGKFKIAERAETAVVLSRLGELTAFTRQLDTSMASGQKVEEFARLFFKKAFSDRDATGQGRV